MPRTGYFIAVAIALISAFAFAGGAGASHQGPDPYFSCQASVARATLLNGNPIPPVDPLGANLDREECAEDLGGLPDIALPRPPSAPVLTTTTGQAETEILCATDDPNPNVTPENNEICDAGRPSNEQQVLATADVTNTRITLGGLTIVVQAANTSARASCGPGNVPVLSSTSQVVGLTVGGTTVPIPPISGQPNQVIEIPGILKITLNELIGREGPYAADAPEGLVTRRAVHIEVVPGAPNVGTVADVVVAESTADFHGLVCRPRGPGQLVCPPGSVPNQEGQCIIDRVDCPPGTGRNSQGQCVITNVKCPDGTIFDVTTFACIERPEGGTLFPLNQQVRNFFRGSPCVGPGPGPLFVVLGTNGPDRITGTNQSDRIFSLAGNDRVSGGRGDDCVEGGSGSDVLDGSNGNDFLLGGTGNDQVNGGPGRDRFSGGSGRDVMSGGTGSDVMRGEGGRDRLQGGFGNDRLFGGGGNDGIHTGNGRDRVSAGAGNDVINAATRGPAAFVDCGPGRQDRVRINRNEVRRIRNCEFVDIFRRIRSQNRPISPR